MEIVKLLAIATLASIIPGQIVRFSFGDLGALTISDVLVLTLDSIFLINALLAGKLKIPTRVFLPWVFFVLAALVSTVLAFGQFSTKEILASSLFLIRFFLYGLLILVFYNIVKKREIERWLKSFLVLGFIFLIIGFFQLIVFSDLSSLAVFGWDPHQKRIVSSLLDPNFSGFVYVIFFTLSVVFYLFGKKLHYLFLGFLFLLAVILTFSRSSYLALVAVILVMGVLKSPKIIGIFFLAIVVGFLLIPQMRLRIIGAVTLDETAKARIISWQNATTIFGDNWIFGTGFNTYRFAQVKYGIFAPGDLGGHSGSGTDSSLLLVAVTTGILGFSLFLYFLITVFGQFVKKANSPLHLVAMCSLLGLVIHSQFVNSFFFPQIMLILWFMLGLVLVDNS